MQTYSFNTAYTQARELYGLALTPDEFETIGLIAWDKIGNKQYKLYKYHTKPLFDKNEYYVDLPCNVDIIEAITTDYEDYQKTTPTTISPNNQSGWIEDYIEYRKYNTNSLYMSGKFIKYREENNRIYLADKFDKVNILYKGVLVDDEGLPFLNSKELDAIAAFCQFVDVRKKANVNRDTQLFQMMPYWENNWKVLCTQARVPDYINQNEMDEILNVATSWDRKRFGKSFKSIR